MLAARPALFLNRFREHHFMAKQDLKAMYRTQTLGEFPDSFEIMGTKYAKVEDLRYGTNPHQPAAFYRPDGAQCVLGAHKILKTGKSGLSQTNIEDMHHAVGILKYLQRPACAVMKHCNPSGAAIQTGDQDARKRFINAPGTPTSKRPSVR
jgi:phosphoribosylaminoimidazolecarboxamide formyltransferase / IMP cyclohydrolase